MKKSENIFTFIFYFFSTQHFHFKIISLIFNLFLENNENNDEKCEVDYYRLLLTSDTFEKKKKDTFYANNLSFNNNGTERNNEKEDKENNITGLKYLKY